MERIKGIQNHPLFQELCSKLQKAEEERPFCRHTMEHFLDVARLMYIYSLEDGAAIEKELIYAAALLHDIGRYEQLVSGTPHETAGAEIAGQIMEDCHFQPVQIREVQSAILSHRNRQNPSSVSTLSEYLYRADKKSRNCFSCPACADCKWPEEKKNYWIET